MTKDAAAKAVDKFAIVGGTFGLFTGFSIISGVEILYFFAKSVKNYLSKKGKMILETTNICNILLLTSSILISNIILKMEAFNIQCF